MSSVALSCNIFIVPINHKYKPRTCLHKMLNKSHIWADKCTHTVAQTHTQCNLRTGALSQAHTSGGAAPGAAATAAATAAIASASNREAATFASTPASPLGLPPTTLPGASASAAGGGACWAGLRFLLMLIYGGGRGVGSPGFFRECVCACVCMCVCFSPPCQVVHLHPPLLSHCPFLSCLPLS